jgi:hypothetical protein
MNNVDYANLLAAVRKYIKDGKALANLMPDGEDIRPRLAEDLGITHDTLVAYLRSTRNPVTGGV